jgi:hypothetical protein
MSTLQLQEKLHGYGHWREELIRATDRYGHWLESSGGLGEGVAESIRSLRDGLANERLLVAFVAEFSRGKTELINALFFSDTGLHLLPSLPGRTTMCPTEIFHDPSQGSYIRLLPIETRLGETTVNEHKQRPYSWLHIELDHTSPLQMQKAFQELAAVKKVTCAEAAKLGLYKQENHPAASSGVLETVEIPCWRHALISFPHALFKEGLCILDTPGLNAMGTEPEMTLKMMLTGAQAIIFVLAADTGVADSDLALWDNHLMGLRNQGKNALAVALNKIDCLRGEESSGEEKLETGVRSKIREISQMLNITEDLIFPVSSKEALLAKLRRDDVLLEKSRLKRVEEYLTNTIIRDRQRLFRETAKATLCHLVNESAGHLAIEIGDAERQLQGLRQLDINNQDMAHRLLEQTQQSKRDYLSGVGIFKSSHKAFTRQLVHLTEILSAATIDTLVRNARKEMLSSLFTPGMKKAMKQVLEDLRLTMDIAMVSADESVKLMKSIYDRFEDEYGCAEVMPPPLSLQWHKMELDRIIEEGDEFRHSAMSTLMEQRAVVRRLYRTVIADARNVFGKAHLETKAWGSSALPPLSKRIKDRRRMIKSRLGVLRKVTESTQTLDAEMAELEKRLAALNVKYREIKEIQAIVSQEDAD